MVSLTSVATVTMIVIVTAGLAAHSDRPVLEAFALALPVLALGQLPMVVRRAGGTKECLDLGEASLIIALALVPGPWVVLLSLPAALAPRLAVGRRPRRALLRTAVVTTSTGIGVLAASAIAGGRDPLVMFPDVRAFAAAAVAAAAYAVSTRIPPRYWFFRAGGGPEDLETPRFPSAVANTALGLAVVVVGYTSPLALPVLPLAAAGLGILYRLKLRSLEEHSHWNEINAMSHELIHGDELAIIEIAGRGAATLFETDYPTLTVWPPPQASMDTRPAMDTRPPLDTLTALDTATATDIPATTDAPTAGNRRPRQEPTAPGRRPRRLSRRVREVTTPLLAGEQQIGVLTLTFDRAVVWHEHEDQVLAAFTHAVSRALVHARLDARTRRQAQEQAHDAGHDWLTGLGNRRLLMARAAAELERQALAGGCAGLLMIDLDRFKIINDTLGHSAGDRVLQAIAERLRRSVRDDDVVARFGGDEFAVLVTGIDNPGQAETVAAELADVLCRDVVLDGMPLAVEASVGLACYPDDGITGEELLQHADIAMYQAKHSHPRWRRFDGDDDDSSLERLALIAELRSAINGNELVLNYQPQVELRTGRISGVEALVRWNHPRRGMLTPETFVPAVEQSGLVQDFTRVILEQALVACAGWRASGFDLTLSVNLSARNLLNTELPGEVAKLLVKHNVPASALTLEITETAMMADKRMAHGLLARLREIGVRIAVDDFGTGFSSLTLLQERVLDEVKVDQSFVRKLLVEQSDAAIVAATIHLAHTHNLRVVAEGVETVELMEALAALHCDFAQGLHIGAAMPLMELTSRLRDTASAPQLAVGTNARILPLRRRRPTSPA